jgi:hypothetical protein
VEVAEFQWILPSPRKINSDGYGLLAEFKIHHLYQIGRVMDFYRTPQLKPESTVTAFTSMTLFELSQSNVRYAE